MHASSLNHNPTPNPSALLIRIRIRSRSMNEKTRIDMHVHMVGNGAGGSGGWLRLSGWHRWLAGVMVRQLGFPREIIDGDLEGVYAEHLLKLVRDSSFDALVLLAHEQVYDADGTPRSDLGSLYVPNDVVLDLAQAASGISGRSFHSSGARRCHGGTRTLSQPRCGPDEMPAELPEHRCLRRALSAFLGTNGGGASPTPRAYGRRTHRPGR